MGLLFHEFLRFCRWPSLIPETNLPTKRKVFLTLLFVPLIMTITIPLSLGIDFTLSQFNLLGEDWQYSPFYEEELTEIRLLDDPTTPLTKVLSIIGLLFLSISIAPALLEEILFRLPLRSSRFLVPASLAALSLFITLTFRGDFIALDFLVLPAFLFGIIFYPKIFDFLAPYRSILYPLYAWFLILSFCLVHASNYTLLSDHAWEVGMFLSVLSYIPISLLLSFLRLRFGFGYAILAHAFNNALFPVFMLALGLLFSFEEIFSYV